jgi:hypothetical protein
MLIAIANPFDANPVVSTAASCHADPVYTRSTLFVVLKYKSPAVSASPSLSTVGSLDFAPNLFLQHLFLKSKH